MFNLQLYEEEKLKKDRLKRDLQQCKRELKDAKAELDRQMKRQEANRVSDTNDKRVSNYHGNRIIINKC